MGFLSDAKFAASSFLSSLMKEDEGVSANKQGSPMPVASHLRGEAKRTWTIRKREFDKLRALRQNEMLNDGKPKHRFFHTSMLTDLSEKTSTIKKIDEIEAQMSMQWWKTERLDLNRKEKAPK
ncbi:MAG: hypothetical protein RL761_900 [Pseudomonadota bacterium]|jgi:hypothetical protein